MREQSASHDADAATDEQAGQLVLNQGVATVDYMRAVGDQMEAQSLEYEHEFVRIAGDCGWTLIRHTLRTADIGCPLTKVSVRTIPRL